MEQTSIFWLKIFNILIDIMSVHTFFVVLDLVFCNLITVPLIIMASVLSEAMHMHTVIALGGLPNHKEQSIDY